MSVLYCQVTQMDTVTHSALHGNLRLVPQFFKFFFFILHKSSFKLKIEHSSCLKARL